MTLDPHRQGLTTSAIAWFDSSRLLEESFEGAEVRLRCIPWFLHVYSRNLRFPPVFRGTPAAQLWFARPSRDRGGRSHPADAPSCFRRKTWASGVVARHGDDRSQLLHRYDANEPRGIFGC